MDGILLETVEGLGHSPFVSGSGEIWQRLQAEKEELNRDLLTDISRCATDVGGSLENEASETYAHEIEWGHRGQLEARLRERGPQRRAGSHCCLWQVNSSLDCDAGRFFVAPLAVEFETEARSSTFFLKDPLGPEKARTTD